MTLLGGLAAFVRIWSLGQIITTIGEEFVRSQLLPLYRDCRRLSTWSDSFSSAAASAKNSSLKPWWICRLIAAPQVWIGCKYFAIGSAGEERMEADIVLGLRLWLSITLEMPASTELALFGSSFALTLLPSNMNRWRSRLAASSPQRSRQLAKFTCLSWSRRCGSRGRCWIPHPSQLAEGDVCLLLSCGRLLSAEQLANGNLLFTKAPSSGRGWSPMTCDHRGFQLIPITLFEAVAELDAGPVICSSRFIAGTELVHEWRALQARATLSYAWDGLTVIRRWWQLRNLSWVSQVTSAEGARRFATGSWAFLAERFNLLELLTTKPIRLF